MKKARNSINIIIAIGILMVMSNGSDAPIVMTDNPDAPQDWLNLAIDAWNQTKSFHVVFELENRVIPIDPSGHLTFSHVEGDVIIPDKFRLTVVVKNMFGSKQIGLMAVGEGKERISIFGSWMKTTIPDTFQIENLFGIGKKIREVSNLEQRQADETVEGALMHLRGDLPGTVLTDFAPELTEQERVKVDLWISRSDHRIQKIIITEPPVDGISPIWTFQFSQHDEVTEIVID